MVRSTGIVAGWINGDCCWLDQRRLLVGSTEIAGWWIEGIAGWINGGWLVGSSQATLPWSRPLFTSRDNCFNSLLSTQLSFVGKALFTLQFINFELSIQQLRTTWCFQFRVKPTLPWYRPLLARRYNCFDSSCKDYNCIDAVCQSSHIVNSTELRW